MDREPSQIPDDHPDKAERDPLIQANDSDLQTCDNTDDIEAASKDVRIPRKPDAP